MNRIITILALTGAALGLTSAHQPAPTGYRSNSILISEFDNCQNSPACRNAPSSWNLDLHMARTVINGKGPWLRCAQYGGSAAWIPLSPFDHRQIICRAVDK